MSHRPDTPNYYMPYDSGDDTDEDTGTDVDYSNDEQSDDEDIRIRREEDPRYAIHRAAGPNFNTSAQQLKYMENAPGATYDTSTNITNLDNLVYLNPPKTTLTSLFSVKSNNRDKTVWPSPFNFTIKTPRVYKNVTKFQLVQLSFPYNTGSLSGIDNVYSTFTRALSTFGYDPSCISTCLNEVTNSGTDFTTIGVSELGRLNTEGDQMLTKLQIPDGSYSNESLSSELTFQANSTPPFNIISFDEFQLQFKITKDASVLFNEPSDNFYSKLTSQRFGRHTKADIMNTYYSQHDIDRHLIITDTIALNAYYYPVLKELVATELGRYFINTDESGITKDDLQGTVLNNFQGLDSELYYTLCSTNRSVLDDYRKNHTFQHKNVNKYTWGFERTRNKFKRNHDTLHTSLKNDINRTLQTYISQELQLHSLSEMTFNNLKKEYANDNTILNHLDTNLSSVMSLYFLDGAKSEYFGGDTYSFTSSDVTFVRSVDELHADSSFTSMFNYKSTFGRQFNNSVGQIFNFNNFLDYHSTLSSYYNIVQSTNTFITDINNAIYDRHHCYVSSKYTGVLPTEMIDNKSYVTAKSLPVTLPSRRLAYTPGESFTTMGAETDSCVSTCLKFITESIKGYYSCLPTQTVINTLGYRLGLPGYAPYTYNNLTTFFNEISTTSFDLLLQINEHQNFNSIDISMKEDYSITNETTGQVRLFCAKILTAGAAEGSITQTCIQNPILFQNYLGKLDKLEFKIFADDDAITPMWLLTPFPLQNQEWTATFQIDEEVAYANRDTGFGSRPTVPIPSDPALMPWVALTSSNNPNNK